ncbi:acetate/propionate family kinase [Leeia sp.]|uniref:acetate/propionate family kinase n=1 Tax=Leeia sp. TaxID=2884678 RepID=UPI0035B307DF
MLLVLNAGSSSLKFALYPQQVAATPLADGLLEWRDGQLSGVLRQDGEADCHWQDEAGAQPHARMLSWLLHTLTARQLPVQAAVHRVVHGGSHFTQALRLDARILAELEALTPLAPLHQPHNLAAVAQLAQLQPDLPQFACFDTAFHRSQLELAQWFALPRSWFEQGVRRYGFHGLSYAWVAHRLPELHPQAGDAKVVALHLGNGASACAMQGMRSVASSMGFTALDGLMMGSRCGQIDPGVLLYAQQHLGMDVGAVEKLLYRQSGLLGVSGLSSDMRTLLVSDAPAARFAVELFCYRAACEVGALATALGGLDVLVFTGGIGEHAAPVRAMICERLAWLGLALDDRANRDHATRLHATASRISVYRIEADEARQMVREVQPLLNS